MKEFLNPKPEPRPDTGRDQWFDPNSAQPDIPVQATDVKQADKPSEPLDFWERIKPSEHSDSFEPA